MKRCQFNWAFFVCAGLTLGQTGWAEDAPRSEAPDSLKVFKELDKNADGQLSADEVSEDRKRFFERLVRVGDKNEDGKLSAEEFQNASKDDERPVEAGRGEGGRGEGRRGGPNPEEMFKRLDINGDGKLTRDEVPERARPLLDPLFDRLDKDELTRDDLAKLRERFGGRGGPGDRRPEGGPRDGDRRPEGGPRDGDRRPEGGPRDGDRRPEGGPRDGDRRPEGGPRDGGRGPGPDGGRRPPLPRFFDKIDANHDGRISADELNKAGELFKELDENEDGQLDPRELMGPPPDDRGGDRFGEGRRPEGGPRDGDRRPEFGPRDGDRRPEFGPRDGGPRGAGPRDGGPREGGPREGGRPFAGRNFGEQFMKQFDKNGDGKISLDEAPDRMKENFKKLDRNGDGQVDLSELPGRENGPPGEGRGRRPDGDRPSDAGRPEAE